MSQLIALSHASGLAAEAILEKLPESGIAPDSLVLLDTQTNAGKRLSFRGGYLPVSDQETFDLSGCALLLMPEIDPLLEARATNQGCIVVSHAIGAETAPVFMEQSGSSPEIAYTQPSIRLAGPEACCLLPALMELNRIKPIQRLNLTLLRSAEFRGKAGVDELASQTVNLLNARPVDPVVYPNQIAFNLLPEAPDPLIDAELRGVLGDNLHSLSLQTLNVPVFHGFVASIQLDFGSAIDIGECIEHLDALENLSIGKGQISPVSDCNQSFDCIISELKQVSGQPSSLHFWVIADPMRYGLANNYVKLTDFLLKSFL